MSRRLIYCDESCHLQNDESEIMILGAISCIDENKKTTFNDIRELKLKHGLSTWTEIKWVKVSNSKLDFYKELIDYFFDNDFLSFRGVVATGKRELDLVTYFDNDFNEWYYRIYFLLLSKMIDPIDDYRIFIDYKDTHGGRKVQKLHEVLCNNEYDFKRDVIKDIKLINSRESELLQLADLFIGALSFYHRGFCEDDGKSKAKKYLASYISQRSNHKLNANTYPDAKKFNLFIWKPRR